MSKLADLKKELRDLRKKHCPPTTKMKKADIEKEVERLRGMEKHTEYQAPPAKARVKKAKVEKKEMAVQASMDSEEEEERREAMAKRMAEVRARRKIAGAVAKAVEAKKEKKKTEEKVETMKKKVAGRKVAEAVKKVVEAKKEKKAAESMADRMARVRAARKIVGAVKKAVETKKGKAKAVAEEAVKAVEKKKAKKEAEAMGAEDVDVGKPKKRKLRREGGEVIKKVNVIEEKVEEKPLEKKSKNEDLEEKKIKLNLKPMKEFMKKYNELGKGKKAAKQRSGMENEIYNAVRRAADYKPDEHPEILKYIFERIEKVKEIYERKDKEQKDKIQAGKEYSARIRKIGKVLNVGDIILEDEEDEEYVVVSIDPQSGDVSIKKPKGKKIIEIEEDSYNKRWEEVLDEEDQEKEKEPLIFSKRLGKPGEKPDEEEKEEKKEKKKEVIDVEKVKYFKAPLAEYAMPDSPHYISGFMKPKKLWEKQEENGKINMVEVLTERNMIPLHPVVVKDVHEGYIDVEEDGKTVKKLAYYQKGEYQNFEPYTQNIKPEDKDKETVEDVKEQYEDRIRKLKNKIEDPDDASAFRKASIIKENEEINKAIKQLEKKIREIK